MDSIFGGGTWESRKSSPLTVDEVDQHLMNICLLVKIFTITIIILKKYQIDFDFIMVILIIFHFLPELPKSVESSDYSSCYYN